MSKHLIQFTQLELFDTKSSLDKETIESTTKEKEKSGTFTDNMKLPVHRWFRYSAGFSAKWVEQVLTDLKPQAVLDPFAGSGTVCVTADKLGIKSYGVESHPFVFELATGKLAWSLDIEEFLIIVEDLKSRAFKTKVNIPKEIPKLLSQCYLSETLFDLFSIRQAYFELSPSLTKGMKNLLFLAISSILRICSNVGTAQWQYILPRKQKTKFLKPFEALDKQVCLMCEDMVSLQSNSKRSKTTFLQEDARSLDSITDESIDCVITSPPYANNYDYADATRLEMTFWGEVNSWSDLHHTVRKFLIRSSSQHVSKDKLCLDQLIDNSILQPINTDLEIACRQLEEIRKTKGGRKHYHTMIAAYFVDLATVLYSLRRVTKNESTMCFVIGDSAPYGIYIPVEEWLGRLAVAAGFNSWQFEKIRQRNVKWKNRKHDVPLHEGRLWITG